MPGLLQGDARSGTNSLGSSLPQSPSWMAERAWLFVFPLERNSGKGSMGEMKLLLSFFLSLWDAEHGFGGPAGLGLNPGPGAFQLWEWGRVS